ncbi:MAG: hypothetical protein KGZ81_06340 [Flavobacteriales bacterium]|nr:hypothetical protein [Flavobacteriales bacterium]
MLAIIKNWFQEKSALETFLRREYALSQHLHFKLISDRRVFYEKFKQETAQILFTRDELEDKTFLLNYLFERKEPFLWLKKKHTLSGSGLARINKLDFSKQGLLKWMHKHGFFYVELDIPQASGLKEVAPKGLNTLNVLTWKAKASDILLLGAAMQWTCFSPLDSLDAGGIWQSIDPDFGFPVNRARQISPAPKVLDYHPLTGVKFKEFSILEMDEVHTLLSDSYHKLGIEGLLSWEIVLQEKGPKLLGISNSTCLNNWLAFGDLHRMSMCLDL